MADTLVLETAGFLDLMVGNAEGRTVGSALRGRAIHVSDHCAAVVGQGLRVMTTRGLLSRRQLDSSIRLLVAAPLSPIPRPACSRVPGPGTACGWVMHCAWN